jgi:hypothetical protein
LPPVLVEGHWRKNRRRRRSGWHEGHGGRSPTARRTRARSRRARLCRRACPTATAAAP